MPRESMTYQTRTDSDLKSTFLRILEKKPLSDMTIAEVVREAHVSRSTFYLHYQNLGELYDEMVREVACQVLPLLTRCGCNCEPENGKQPFCHIVRESNQYTPLFRETRFLETILQSEGAAEQSVLIAKLMDRGLDAQQARAIFAFQMSGCFAVSSMLGAENADWAKIRATLDRYIQGGLDALESEGVAW